jgi:hypothetical protein
MMSYEPALMLQQLEKNGELAFPLTKPQWLTRSVIYRVTFPVHPLPLPPFTYCPVDCQLNTQIRNVLSNSSFTARFTLLSAIFSWFFRSLPFHFVRNFGRCNNTAWLYGDVIRSTYHFLLTCWTFLSDPRNRASHWPIQKLRDSLRAECLRIRRLRPNPTNRPQSISRPFSSIRVLFMNTRSNGGYKQ